MKAKNEYRIDGDVVYIKLTKGQEAKVDLMDLPLVAKHRWCARRATNTGSFYAVSRIRHPDGGLRSDGTKVRQAELSMARLILGLVFGDKRIGDHINHDTLDNRRINLRIATNAQNVQNSRVHPNNTSGYIGVHWYKARNKWRALIDANGKQRYLGIFSDPAKAAKAYDVAATELHGEFAKTNFSRDVKK